MITRIKLLSGNGLDGDYAFGYPQDVLEFTGSYNFREFKCSKCGIIPDRRRLVIHDWRPTAVADKDIPTLVGIYGWTSPRGAFSWEVPDNVPHLAVLHYYAKDDGWIFFLLAPGGRVRKMTTRRYFDADLWFPYNGTEGRIFSQGDDMASILWVEGKLLPFEPPEIEERPHYRCQKVAPDLERDGYCIHRLEGRTRLFRNGELITFVEPGDIPEGVCRSLGIQNSEHAGIYTADEYVCQAGSTPVFFRRCNVNQKPFLYWSKYTLQEGERTKLKLLWEHDKTLTQLQFDFSNPYPKRLWVKKEVTEEGSFYTLMIDDIDDDD